MSLEASIKKKDGSLTPRMDLGFSLTLKAYAFNRPHYTQHLSSVCPQAHCHQPRELDISKMSGFCLTLGGKAALTLGFLGKHRLQAILLSISLGRRLWAEQVLLCKNQRGGWAWGGAKKTCKSFGARAVLHDSGVKGLFVLTLQWRSIGIQLSRHQSKNVPSLGTLKDCKAFTPFKAVIAFLAGVCHGERRIVSQKTGG